MSGTNRSIQAAGSGAHGHHRATEGNHKPRRRAGRDTGTEAPLRLLAGSTRPMSSEEEKQLVEALTELLSRVGRGSPATATEELENGPRM